MVEARVEAALLKATDTFEATPKYGLAGYTILSLVPVGVYSENSDLVDYEEVMGPGAVSRGFERLHGKVNKACAWCRKARDMVTEKTKLYRCSGCEDTVYCSKEHQKLDWEEQLRGCF